MSIASLGLAVMSVFIIAGLRHTGRMLENLPWHAHLALIFMTGSGLVRVLPELGVGTSLLGMHYVLSAALWSAPSGTKNSTPARWWTRARWCVR